MNVYSIDVKYGEGAFPPTRYVHIAAKNMRDAALISMNHISHQHLLKEVKIRLVGELKNVSNEILLEDKR